MNIADNLNRIIQAKSDIKTAIEKKGVDVGDITIDKYAEKIDLIEQGGGSGVKIKIKEGISLSGSTFTSFDASNWDWSNVHECGGMFKGCKNLESITGNMNLIPFSIGYCFSECTNLSNIDALANWDTSKVTNMSNMFSGCTNLSNIDALANWDVSNLTDTYNMFSGCTNLSNIDALANWQLPVNVRLYLDGTAIEDLNALANWEGSYISVANCANLKDISVMTSWNLKMSGPFYYFCDSCTSLEKIDISNWDLSEVTDFYYFCADCTSLTEFKMGGPLNPNFFESTSVFRNIRTTGTFYYPKEYDYSGIEEVLPPYWVAVPY